MWLGGGKLTNSIMLRNLVKKRGLKYKYVAEYLGLSPYGLQLKIDNKHEFKTGEITSLCVLLGVKSLEEKEEIFFVQNNDFKSPNELKQETKETDAS